MDINNYVSAIALILATKFGFCQNSTKSDTLYTVAYSYHKAYSLEGIHDAYIVERIQEVYLKVIKLDPQRAKAYYNLGLCYISEATFYLGQKKRKVRNLRMAKQYKKKAIRTFKKYTQITGQKVSVE